MDDKGIKIQIVGLMMQLAAKKCHLCAEGDTPRDPYGEQEFSHGQTECGAGDVYRADFVAAILRGD